MFKKPVRLAAAMVLVMMALTACQTTTKPETEIESKTEPKTELAYQYEKTAEDIAQWTSMVTPGGGEGSVTKGDNVAIVEAAADGWGGVQSEKITLDLTKDPLLLVQVLDCADEFKWGVKFVPDAPATDEHKWGIYLIQDNNFKWDNYAGVDVKERLGQEFIDLYGETPEGVLWIYAVGGPEASVSVTSIKILNQK